MANTILNTFRKKIGKNSPIVSRMVKIQFEDIKNKNFGSCDFYVQGVPINWNIKN